MIENLPGSAAFIVDRDLRYLLAKGEALGDAGFKPEDLIGKTIFEALPPELSESYEPFYRKALAGEPFAHEHAAHGRSFISRGVPLRGARGEVYAALTVSYDITERKRAEELLRESEGRLQKAISIETVGVIFFNEEGRFTDCNEAFTWMSGYTRGEMSSGELRWADLTPPEWMGRSREAAAELKAKGRISPYEKEHFRKDGSRFWGLFAGSKINDQETVEYVIDVSARKQAEEYLRASEERLRQLNEKLEERVRERTRELQEKAVELLKEVRERAQTEERVRAP